MVVCGIASGGGTSGTGGVGVSVLETVDAGPGCKLMAELAYFIFVQFVFFLALNSWKCFPQNNSFCSFQMSCLKNSPSTCVTVFLVRSPSLIIPVMKPLSYS